MMEVQEQANKPIQSPPDTAEKVRAGIIQEIAGLQKVLEGTREQIAGKRQQLNAIERIAGREKECGS